jgi:hypothetical protein
MEKWLPAVWMIVNDKNGISSYELHRALDVTQKTAWFMLHRIRLAMQAARPSGDGGRFMTALRAVTGRRLTYKALIASAV